MNEAQRASLIEAHRPLVFKAVRLVWPRVRGYVEREDLIAMADLGLVEAASRFDPDAGVKFATFAWYRVQGAVLDGLRRSAALPRRAWAQLSAMRAAAEVMEARIRRDAAARAAGASGAAAPTSTAARLAVLRDALADVETTYALALVSASRSQLTDPAELPDEALERVELTRRVADAVSGLPERERALVEKHYFEGKNLLEAGEELGISKSWASRVHAQAVDRLRKRLAQAP